MGQFDGKTALVTGATSGIGLATARRLIAEGAAVIITGRRKPELDTAVADLGPNASGVPGDVSNLADLDAVMAVIAARGKGLDVLFANAGGGEVATLEQTTEAHFDHTFAINVKGMLFTVQKALPLLNPGASIVLAGSSAATSGTPSFGTYGATKAAVRAYARTWAAELAERDIRVNVIAPGPIDTPGLSELAPDPAQAQALLDTLASGVPIGRVGHADEVAAAVAFLASSQSSFITGTELAVDGGLKQI